MITSTLFYLTNIHLSMKLYLKYKSKLKIGCPCRIKRSEKLIVLDVIDEFTITCRYLDNKIAKKIYLLDTRECSVSN